MSLYDQFKGKNVRYKTVASQPWETGHVEERRHEDSMVLYIRPIEDPLSSAIPDERPLRFGAHGVLTDGAAIEVLKSGD